MEMRMDPEELGLHSLFVLVDILSLAALLIIEYSPVAPLKAQICELTS